MGLIGNYLRLASMSKEIGEKNDVGANLANAQARMNAANAAIIANTAAMNAQAAQQATAQQAAAQAASNN